MSYTVRSLVMVREPVARCRTTLEIPTKLHLKLWWNFVIIVILSTPVYPSPTCCVNFRLDQQLFAISRDNVGELSFDNHAVKSRTRLLILIASSKRIRMMRRIVSISISFQSILVDRFQAKVPLERYPRLALFAPPAFHIKIDRTATFGSPLVLFAITGHENTLCNCNCVIHGVCTWIFSITASTVRNVIHHCCWLSTIDRVSSVTYP